MNLFVYTRRVTITIDNERKVTLTATIGFRSEGGLAKLDTSPTGGRSAGISDKSILGCVARDTMKFQFKEELESLGTCVSCIQEKNGAMSYLLNARSPQSSGRI